MIGGLDLAVFSTMDEWVDVRRAGANTWFGLTDWGTEGAWRTASGHPPPTMAGWPADEPNNSGAGQHCAVAHFSYAGTWDDGTCANVYPYYCAEPLDALDAPRLCLEHPDLCPFPSVTSGGSTYLLVDEALDWTRSLQLCRQLGMELATVDDATEDALLSTLSTQMGATHAWIGLHDQGQEGVFHWADGTPPGYSSFRAAQPDGAETENCVRHWAMPDGDGRMSDFSCDDPLPFICEAPQPADACLDADGDGYGPGCLGGGDCNPQNPIISPGAVDRCELNGTDISCSGEDGNGQSCGCVPVDGSAETLYCGVFSSWSVASNTCADLGGALATVDNDLRQETIAAFMDEAPDFAWLGLSDAAVEGEWRWPDGSLVVFERWAPGQPDNGVASGGAAQNCGAISTLGDRRWRDLPCSSPQPFFCDVP